MSKQLAAVSAGVATTVGIGSQYISSAGEAVSALNYIEEFSTETEGETFQQAFTTVAPSTFLTEEVEEVGGLSGFETAAQFEVVSTTSTETTKPPAPKAAASAPKVKATAKVTPKKSKPVVRRSGDEFKKTITFRFAGYSFWSWDTNWENNGIYYIAKYGDTLSYTNKFRGIGKSVGSLTVKCNKDGRDLKCWNDMTKKSFILHFVRASRFIH